MQIRLIKPLKNKIVSYSGELLARDKHYVLVLACWSYHAVDLGYLHFQPGDLLYEHFYADRWYNIFDVRDADGMRKGWYCNLTRPACITETVVESEDLELDLFVSPDRRTVLTLDEDEYLLRGLEQHEPAAHQAAMAALEELRGLIARGEEPFL